MAKAVADRSLRALNRIWIAAAFPECRRILLGPDQIPCPLASSARRPSSVCASRIIG